MLRADQDGALANTDLGAGSTFSPQPSISRERGAPCSHLGGGRDGEDAGVILGRDGVLVRARLRLAQRRPGLAGRRDELARILGGGSVRVRKYECEAANIAAALVLRTSQTSQSFLPESRVSSYCVPHVLQMRRSSDDGSAIAR